MVNRRRIKGDPKPRLTLPILAVVILIIGGLLWRVIASAGKPFLVVAVASDPVQIFFYDRSSGRSSLLSIPAAAITGVSRGYGNYSLESVWRLSPLEKSPAIFSETLEYATGLPVTAYIGATDGRLLPEMPLDRLFSLNLVPAFLGGTFRSNLGLADYISLVRVLSTETLARTKTITVTDQQLREITLPDGSKVQEIDGGGLDRLYSHAFEIESLRGENLRISVTNMTGRAGLGQAASRILTNFGALVVRVDSMESDLAKCQIRIPDRLARTVTVAVVRSIFNCRLEKIGPDDAAEISIRLGSDYKARIPE
ncbi:hypothetical protein A2Z33_01270 [Candidatus Gottesmanbacteria bacterium RBG_16_52_11]|uniref:LytR/CpsA/Psr regulator C-terminal domain-containing protein n=1 Tax=Candidatus Gottesmanbacteria bacterium RBG_16_52_11 TaxID=1798374 RepID=A0A1F5YP42_9BACT|nr:MAG: hypothetical protein A2Z33_01270 [Candidatus Gottesmanbacteria bacterium RBG_16_52_11]